MKRMFRFEFARQGEAGQGSAWQGAARRGKARVVSKCGTPVPLVGLRTHEQAWRGAVGHGAAGRGGAWRGTTRLGRAWVVSKCKLQMR